MPKKLIEIASEIVQTQVSTHTMTAADITSSLRQVFSTLHELQRAESGEIELPKAQVLPPAKEVSPQALAPEDSIQNDKVICLECGTEMKQLTVKHLSSHNLNLREYKKKYGFPMKIPLSAKSLTKARIKAAKKRGLPEKLKAFIEARRQKKAKASTPAATETVTAGKPMAAEVIMEGLQRGKPTLTPENSIQKDKVICLECGAEMKQLTQTHLSSHGMSPKGYKSKYGFSMGTSLSAKSLTKALSEAAKKRGLPDNLKKAIEAKRQEKVQASTQSATETVTANNPKRTRLRKKVA